MNADLVLTVALQGAFHCVMAAMVLTLWRLVRGPTLADRVAALDMLTLLGLVFIALEAVCTREYAYLDVAIALALVGFLATVAFARYLMQAHARQQQNAAQVPPTVEGESR